MQATSAQLQKKQSSHHHHHHHHHHIIWKLLAGGAIAAIGVVVIVLWKVERKKKFAPSSSQQAVAQFSNTYSSLTNASIPPPSTYDHFVGKYWDTEVLDNFYSAAGNAAECAQDCNSQPNCVGFSYNATWQVKCYLKQLKQGADWVTGVRRANGTFNVYSNRLIDGKFNIGSPLSQMTTTSCVNACNGNINCDAFSLNTHTGICFLKQFTPNIQYDYYLKQN